MMTMLLLIVGHRFVDGAGHAAIVSPSHAFAATLAASTISNSAAVYTNGREVMPTPPSSSEARLVRFAVFEVDLAAGELRKNGARLRLQEQPFQVLAVLLENAGRVVTREDLRQKIWPADTFVDFDHSVNTAVAKVREALGDSATSPRFVETLARRGYRFIAPVNGVEAPAANSPNAATSDSASGMALTVEWPR